MSDDILKDKRWKDLKPWQKAVFISSSILFLAGLIYLPIEYNTKMKLGNPIEVENGMNGCNFYFAFDNLTSVVCHSDNELGKLNFSGKFDKYYTVDNYVKDHDAWITQLRSVEHGQGIYLPKDFE